MDAHLSATFWNYGYLIGILRVSKHTIRAALEEARSPEFKPIFGERCIKTKRDPNRLQARIPAFGPATEKIYKRIRGILMNATDEWYTKRALWAALKSLPGGLRQGIHSDFPMFETSKAILEKGVVQASVIVALMPRTYFYIYPGCVGPYADEDKCTKVTLNAGEFLLFRGDLVHAGAEYEEENLRLHCYVRVRGIKQKHDATEAAVFNSIMCEHCVQRFRSRRHLANHRWFCDENPKKKRKIKEQWKKTDDQGDTCSECNITFKKRSALHQHNHRRHPKKARLSLAASKGHGHEGHSSEGSDRSDALSSDSVDEESSEEDSEAASEEDNEAASEEDSGEAYEESSENEDKDEDDGGEEEGTKLEATGCNL